MGHRREQTRRVHAPAHSPGEVRRTSSGPKKPVDKEAFIREIVGSDVDPVASQTLGRVAPQNEPLFGRQFVLNRKHVKFKNETQRLQSGG